jgi:hypothetical protein
LILKIFNRFEGQRQSIDHYGRQHGQDSQEKHEFKSLSVNPAETTAAKPAAAAADDDDVDLFGDDDEEESEQTKQRLAAYAAKKSNSKSKNFL